MDGDGRLRLNSPLALSRIQSPGPRLLGQQLTQHQRWLYLSKGCLAQSAEGTHHTTSVAESCSGRRSSSLTGEQLITNRCIQVLLGPGRGAFPCPLSKELFGNVRNWVPQTRRLFCGKSRLNRISLLSVTFPKARVGKLPCEKLALSPEALVSVKDHG